MIDLNSMIENESVEDVLMFLAPQMSYPRIDYWYVQYKFDVIAHGLLVRVSEKLFREGKLARDEKGRTIKGPYWTPPQFVLDKKYGIE